MTLVLDAGALIAIERADRQTALLLERARREGLEILVPAVVWAQVWRGGARQARLARLRAVLGQPLVPFTSHDGDQVGVLLAASGSSDVVDAQVVLLASAHEGSVVLTSDPADLRALDAAVRLVEV